jgi:phage replication O-like protein O
MPGYTKFDNSILEKVLTSNLTKRQLKILLLIVRFSAGCQKTYAVLRRNDFTYAGISSSCVTNELKKLVKLRVIKWDSRRDLVWLNPDLSQWAVDRPGENPGDNLRGFFKIARKNLLKWQVASFQIGNPEVAKTGRISGGIKEKKENINKNRIITRILTRYLQEVAPLSREEAAILREVLKSHSTRVVEEAITEAASGNSRTFCRLPQGPGPGRGAAQARTPLIWDG